MTIITEKDLLAVVQGKRIPTVQVNVTCADLSLQELEIVKAMRDCDTLGKVGALVDKLIMYVALSKSHANLEG